MDYKRKRKPGILVSSPPKRPLSEDKKLYNLKKAGKNSLSLLFTTAAVLAAAALFMLFANKFLFRIKNVELNSTGRYTREQILAAAGISEGGELFSVNTSEAADKLSACLPYVESVSIVRVLPSSLKINLAFREGIYAVKLGGDYYILSENFIALEKIPAAENRALPENTVLFKTGAVKKCVVGEEVVFADSDVAVFLRELRKIIKAEEIEGEFKSIDITNKFNVTAEYGERFKIKFGTFETVDLKVKNLLQIIDYLHADDTGIIDMTDERVAPFTRLSLP